MFIVFDGVDGAGKTTQINLLVDWFKEQGRDVVTCKDPGSTELGEALRAVLLNHGQTPIHMRSEMMMFTKARTQLIQQVVKPALAAGKTVILDRYIFATVVYQGHAGGLDPEDIWTVNRIATENTMPELTLFLDIPVDVAMKRLGDSLDRMESRGEEYFQRVRSGFLLEAKRFPEDVKVIDANQDVGDIHEQIKLVARTYFENK